MFYKKGLPQAGIVILFALLQTACTTSQAPARKKMPGYLTAGQFESDYYFKSKANNLEKLSFSTSQDEVMLNGNSTTCLSVPLPTAEHDALILSLVQEYKPLASLLLDNWAKEGHKTVIIDLRNNQKGSASQAQYVITKAEAFSITIMFRWDMGSSVRASNFMSYLKDVPGLTIVKL